MIKIPQNKEFEIKGFDNIIFRINDKGILQGRMEEEFTWHEVISKLENNVLNCSECYQGQYDFEIKI